MYIVNQNRGMNTSTVHVDSNTRPFSLFKIKALLTELKGLTHWLMLVGVWLY